MSKDTEEDYTTEEAAAALGADVEDVRRLAAEIGVERFRGQFVISPDELAVIAETLGSEEDDDDGDD